jgi:flagellar basal-body rod protein FlgB
MAIQEAALGLRAYRQQVLAGNIANADTPNYKARDFDFSAILKDSMAGRGMQSVALSKTSPKHLDGKMIGDGSPILQYRVPVQMSADGNTVEMDTERHNFTENAVMYQAGISFITHHLRTLTSAIQGQ